MNIETKIIHPMRAPTHLRRSDGGTGGRRFTLRIVHYIGIVVVVDVVDNIVAVGGAGNKVPAATGNQRAENGFEMASDARNGVLDGLSLGGFQRLYIRMRQ